MAKTLDHLKEAFAGESQANRKYLAFSKKADEEGLPQAARLFRAAAEAETVHALAHLDAKRQRHGARADASPLGQSAVHRSLRAVKAATRPAGDHDRHHRRLSRRDGCRVPGDNYHGAYRRLLEDSHISVQCASRHASGDDARPGADACAAAAVA